MRLRKQKRTVAVTLATAIAVSTISASASAVQYDLANGDVTIDQSQDRGAFSYQGKDEEKNRTYVNEDTKDEGKIIINQSQKSDNSDNADDHADTDNADNADNSGDENTTPIDHTVTVKEDVKKADKKDGSEGYDVAIEINGVNADTTESGKSTVTIGEGADVDLTVKDSTLTTGGNGIDIGVNLDGKDENKETKVDLTLEDTTINLTKKDNTVGIDARDKSKVDISLKGNNTIDGQDALEDAAQEAEKAGNKKTPNCNVEGIRVGGESAGDSNSGNGSTVTIKGDETGDGGNLNIDHTSTGMVITNNSDVTLTDSADVDIKHTEAISSTQGGRGIVQRGDLTVEDKSSLTIDTVGKGAYKIDDDKDGMVYGNYGYGIDGSADITVKDGSTLEIKGTQSSAIYGGKDASLTVEGSTLNIDSNGRGIDYQGNAGDITFNDSKVDIDSKGMGIATGGKNSNTTVTFDNTTANVSAELTNKENEGKYAIYCEDSGEKGSLIVTNGSKLKLQANYGIVAGYRNVLISGNSTVDSTTRDTAIQLRNSKGTKLHITDGSVYNMTDGSHDNYNLYAYNYDYNANHDILVDKGGVLSMDLHNSHAGICLGMNCTLTVDDGTVLVKGDYKHSGIYIDGPFSKILIKNNAHVEAPTIVGNTWPGQKLVVTGGTLTYDYSADNTLWPVNEQGDKLTNFLLTKDDAHADFDAIAYNGDEFEYVSDLKK